MHASRMVEMLYQGLSVDDRRYALRVAQEKSQYPAFLLDKDIWVVATLRTLFNAPFSSHLIFKGGTSLSKVWQAIRRFSEDIDVTYDIRAFAPHLPDIAFPEVSPTTMLADGMLLDENEPFDSLIERCASIEARANSGCDDAHGSFSRVSMQ